MSTFDMTPIATSLYASSYDSYSSTTLTPIVQDIGVQKKHMDRKKAKGSASHMPHRWMLTLIEYLYNESSFNKNWLSRELGSSQFAQTYAEVSIARKNVIEIQSLLDLFLLNNPKYMSVVKQLNDRISSPSDYPLVGWPNGFVHGFENADITVIIALFYDLEPPEEWVWKSTLESLVGAIYDPKSPNGNWKDRTNENFLNGTFVPDSVHEIPIRSESTLKWELVLRFQLKNGLLSLPMTKVKSSDAAYWAGNIYKYTQDSYEEDTTGGFGFTNKSQKQLLDAFRNVADEMRIGSAYVYQLRFFINSFVPPQTWGLYNIGHVLRPVSLQSVPTQELTDKDYIEEAVRGFGDKQRKSMTPMPEIFDEVMAEEPPVAPPVPTQLDTVPAHTFIPTAETAKYMVAQATFSPLIPTQPAVVPNAQKRSYEEVPNLKHIRKEYSTSGAGGMLSKLEGMGMYKGSALSNPNDDTAAVVRVNHGIMNYTDGFIGSLGDTKYDGGWKNNLWHGHGVLHFPGHYPIIPLSMAENTPCIYDGNFSNGEFDGVGRLYLLALGQSWEGMWKDGKRTSHTSRMSFPPKAASHWATTRQLIGIWPQESDDFIDIAKYAHQRGSELTRHLPSASSQRVLVQLPHFETDIHTPNGGGIVLRASTPEAYVAICEFFRASNPLWLGWGADASNYAKYNFIVPVATFDIDYSTHKIFHDHKTAMGVMGVDRRVENSKKMLQNNPTLKGTLDVQTCTRIGEFLKKLNNDIFSRNETSLVVEQNEQFLFHGGPWSAIWNILQSGFDEKRASNGLYGRGCYFAEDPGKCDQYAGNDNTPSMTQQERKYVQEHFGISDQQIADAVINKDDNQDIFCILMCRVVLGSSIHRSLEEFGTNRTGPPGEGIKVQYGKNKGQDEPLFYGDDGKPMPYDLGSNTMRKAKDLNRVLNSVIGKMEIGTHTSNRYRYREFITYKGIIARPTQLIFYKRVKQDLPFNYTWTDAYACP